MLVIPFFITTRQRSFGKVMFSDVSVCLFTGSSYITITHDVLDLTVEAPPLALALALAPRT